MRLAIDRFYKNQLYVKTIDGKTRPMTRYGYETHKGIFDINIIEGDPVKYYVTNMTEGGKKLIHTQIEKHFNI